jgi:ATP-dependent RNA helicase DDX10/DBP4
MAKKVGHSGTRIKFDEEGVAHQVYDLISEAEFLAQGSPEEQKRQFVEETSRKMQSLDENDREEAKEKKRQKRAKKRGGDELD